MFDEIVKLAQQISESGRIIGQKLSNMGKELVKEESFYKGEQFEVFVEDNLFPKAPYDLIRRTDTHERNKRRFAKGSVEPDLLFKCRKTHLYFFVECKYRSKLVGNKLIWCEDYQFDRYREMDKPNRPVFVAIGFSGASNNPNKIFFFHINQVDSHEIDSSIITQFEVEKKAISLIYLKSLSGKSNV